MDSQRRPKVVVFAPLHLALPGAAACPFKDGVCTSYKILTLAS